MFDSTLNERELEIVRACEHYATHFANAGLPGHALQIVIAKLSMQNAGLHAELKYNNTEPEDHKEYVAKRVAGNKIVTPLAKKVTTKYGG